MGDEQHPEPGLGDDAGQQVGDLRLRRGVQGADGLVRHHATGLGGQHPGNGDALALPAGELVGETVGDGGREPDPLEQDADPGLRRLVIELGPRPQADGVGDLAPDPPAGVERCIGILEDHLQGTELAGPGGPADHLHRLPAVPDVAGARGDEADGRPSQGGLPTTRFAHQADYLPGVDGQRRADDGPHGPVAPAVVGDVQVG